MQRTASSTTVAHALGEITWLLSQSSSHKNMTLADLEQLVMPAILLKQFRIFYDDNDQPIGFACWAMVSEEVAENAEQAKLRNEEFIPQPAEWKSGERQLLTVLASPYATEENGLLESLSKNVKTLNFKSENSVS